MKQCKAKWFETICYLATLSLLAIVTTSGCARHEPWPSYQVEIFTAMCIDEITTKYKESTDDAIKYCDCALTKLEAKFDAHEYAKIEGHFLATRTPPSELEPIIEPCVQLVYPDFYEIRRFRHPSVWDKFVRWCEFAIRSILTYAKNVSYKMISPLSRCRFLF